ncbi:MAG TPA: hypothetical protein VGC41_12190 [Kofleriaceae bacterium]
MGQARTGMQLVGLLLACALATSRLGLVAHELVGHGGAATLVGGHVTEVQLFWFAGGWIRYTFPAPPSVAEALFISMGGILIEILVGVALATITRRARPLGTKLIRAIGAALVIHASWYLATGAWSGFGDGQLLYKVAGTARYPIAIAAGAITCTVGFFAARSIVGPLRATQRTTAAFILAALVAGGIHVALSIGEVRFRRDPTYSVIMQPERDRQIDRDLAKWEAYERTRGQLTEERRIAEQARLAEVHHTFPFAWLLGACAVVAILAGAWRSRIAEDLLTSRLVVRAIAIAGASVLLVIAIDVITR